MASGQIAKRFDVLITEIFPDPTPSVGLPPNEFIELRNVSTAPVNLKDWKVGDRNSLSTITIAFVLQPDSVAIISSSSASVNFAKFGRTVGVSNFPSLDNDGDLIVLRSKEGTVIHAVNYSNSWYKNDLKSQGGWSLEMIDIKNPCAGSSNWRASMERIGGTPGKRNSLETSNEDVVSPVLLRTYAMDSITLVAVFDEPVDSLSASMVTKYVFDENNANPFLAIPSEPLFTEVILKFRHELKDSTVYHLTVFDIEDCSGNITGKQKVKAGLPSIADESDIIVNEILFNPKADGFDYLEIYNKSRKVIDLQQLYAANKDPTGAFTNIVHLSDIPYLVFPGEFVVFTESKGWLKQAYLTKEDQTIIELPSLPALPDDKGSVAILDAQGIIVEQLQYDSKWHFALIEKREGISLERIDYRVPAQQKDNWTSAASTAGYGTPGYQNSQFRADLQVQGFVSTHPKIFSPDNDGLDDLVIIGYQMTAPGYVANIRIYDANGRPVRYLAQNATLASQGFFTWDGLDDNLQRLPVGIYIVFTEVFNLQGKTKKFKNVITLARKL